MHSGHFALAFLFVMILVVIFMILLVQGGKGPKG